MKRLLTLAAAGLLTLGLGTSTAEANHRGGAEQVVDGWYHRFLGRCADEAGYCYWVPVLQRKAPDCALACLVGALSALAIRDVKAPTAERHREALERATVPGAD